MSPSAIEKSGELSRSSSVVPISTYGLSVKRCAAGRSTPTSASTLPGKLSGPNTRMVVSVSCTTDAWKCAASLSAPVLSAAALKPSISPFAASARQVAAPTVRRLSCQAAPGCAGEDRRRDRRQLRVGVGGQGLRPQDQVGLRRPDRVQVGRTAGAHRGQVVHDGAEIGRLAGRSRRAARRATMRDCRPSAHSASSWSPESTTIRLRLRAHDGAACGVADLPVALARIDRQRIGRAGLVGPALIAQHAGAGDLGGAGDDRRLVGRRRRACRPGCRSRRARSPRRRSARPPRLR